MRSTSRLVSLRYGFLRHGDVRTDPVRRGGALLWTAVGIGIMDAVGCVCEWKTYVAQVVRPVQSSDSLTTVLPGQGSCCDHGGSSIR